MPPHLESTPPPSPLRIASNAMSSISINATSDVDVNIRQMKFSFFTPDKDATTTAVYEEPNDNPNRYQFYQPNHTEVKSGDETIRSIQTDLDSYTADASGSVGCCESSKEDDVSNEEVVQDDADVNKDEECATAATEEEGDITTMEKEEAAQSSSSHNNKHQFYQPAKAEEPASTTTGTSSSQDMKGEDVTAATTQPPNKHQFYQPTFKVEPGEETLSLDLTAYSTDTSSDSFNTDASSEEEEDDDAFFIPNDDTMKANSVPAEEQTIPLDLTSHTTRTARAAHLRSMNHSAMESLIMLKAYQENKKSEVTLLEKYGFQVDR